MRPFTIVLACAVLAFTALAGCAALENWNQRARDYRAANEQEGRDAARQSDPAMGVVHDAAASGVTIAAQALPPPFDLLAMCAGNVLLGGIFGRHVGWKQRERVQTTVDATWDEAAGKRAPGAIVPPGVVAGVIALACASASSIAIVSAGDVGRPREHHGGAAPNSAMQDLSVMRDGGLV